MAEASLAYDLPPSEIEAWMDDGKSGMENALKARIAEKPSFGDRTVGHLLQFNQNTLQRLFELQGWMGLPCPKSSYIRPDLKRKIKNPTT